MLRFFPSLERGEQFSLFWGFVVEGFGFPGQGLRDRGSGFGV